MMPSEVPWPPGLGTLLNIRQNFASWYQWRACMKIKYFIRIIFSAGVLGSALLGSLAWSQTKPGAETNPILEEMAALDPAFKTIIDAVVLGDMQRITPALMGVTEARERVERAVKAGQKILLPKNQSQLREFLLLDEQFHVDLEELNKAAETGQKKVVKNYAHKLLDACVVCHEKYRK
jgi:cytochrome c556